MVHVSRRFGFAELINISGTMAIDTKIANKGTIDRSINRQSVICFYLYR
jgi:hypothetical protein